MPNESELRSANFDLVELIKELESVVINREDRFTVSERKFRSMFEAEVGQELELATK